MRRILICLFLAAIGAGCVHSPKPGLTGDLPPGAPEATAVLDDLTQTSRTIANFSSNGTIIMKLPGEEAVQRFTRCIVRFQQPDTFFISATKAGIAVRIYAGDGTFLLEQPSERRFFYGHDGDRFPDVSLEVAPSVILREYFLADTLPGIDPELVEVLRYDPETGSAVVALYRNARRRTVERLLHVEPGPDGWRIYKNERFNGAGKPIVETTYDDFGTVDGVVMPRRIAASLPGDQGRLSFEIQSNGQVNRQNPDPIDDVMAVRQELLGRGFEEITGVPAEAQPR